MKKTLATFALAAAMLTAQPAFAHGGDHPMHGGQVMLVGETMFELVVQPAGASLYVMDDGDPVDAATMTAKLTLTAGGKKTEVPMVAAGGNRFVAKGAKLAKGAKVGVLIVDRQTQSRQSTIFTIQ